MSFKTACICVSFKTAQAGVRFCCLHAAKSVFLATRPICSFPEIYFVAFSNKTIFSGSIFI